MSDIDKDLQRRLQRFAEGISPEPGRSAVVVRSARRNRRVVVLTAGLAVVLAIGGLAGATTLLGDRDRIRPAPGPEETSDCVSADYDLAVFVPEKDFHDKMVELNDRLTRHDAVASFEFVSAAEALQEYLRENPDHTGPLPTQARRSQYRVTVEAGVDPHRLSRELADLGDGAFVPALDCPPSQPQQKFARYVFEVDKGNASASGTLEIDWDSKTLCLEVEARAIEASHLLFMDPDAPDGRGVVVLTFFDPHDGEEGAELPATGTHCFAGQQLDELDDELLVRLLDSPEQFRIDFHRGPEDEPGLVAELIRQGEPRDDDVETFAAALFKDNELTDAVPAGFSLREIIRHGPEETNHDYATVGVQMDGPVSYARVIFFVHPTERDAADMAIRRSEALTLEWKTARDGSDEVVKPFAVSNALPGSTCGSEPAQLVACHASLGRVVVVTQSAEEGPATLGVTKEELEAATTLIRSFGSYLERIYPPERRFGDAIGTS